jgi:hypothetical protein
MARIKPTGFILTASLLLTVLPAQGFPQAQDLVVGVWVLYLRLTISRPRSKRDDSRTNAARRGAGCSLLRV